MTDSGLHLTKVIHPKNLSLAKWFNFALKS